MTKKKIFLYFVLAFLSFFPFNLRTVHAYFAVESSPVVNQLSIAEFYTDTYIYNLRNRDGTVTKLGEKVILTKVGDTVNIDAPNVNVSSYTLSSITINGSGSYSIGDTYTQPSNDLTIVYTYEVPLQTFNVTHNTGSFNYSGNSTVLEGNTYTATVTPNNNYTLTNGSVTMGGRTLTEGTDYTMSLSNGVYTFRIPNVSGNIDINITVTQDSGGGGGICIAEGTEVLLWNGTTKKIEDITYNDLLKVWNHDRGSYGYEYAGWIEKVGTAASYTEVTFSDGNKLKFVGDHSIFSKTHNKYVNILSDEFNVGDEVINLSDGIQTVTVTDIKKVNKNIHYYHVISSRYFNLITNDILTTYEIYGNVSNFMGFGDNLKWLNTEEVRNDMFTYEDLPYMDHYLFKVFRLEETKYLLNRGLVSQAEFDDLYQNYLLNNDKKVKPPTNVDGNYLWMVTTSDDDNPSDVSHQMVEGSEFTVPEANNTDGFTSWYNHSDNKYYQPGDVITVDSSMYLEAIYE